MIMYPVIGMGDNMDINSNYHQINSLSIGNDGNKYLFFDIFAVNDELILVCPMYSLKHMNAIDISYNDQILSNRTVMKYYDGPILIIKYKLTKHLTNTNININILYDNNKISEYSLYHLKTKPKMHKYLMASTLCKNDHNDIPIYKNFYEQQGCDFFIFYYNGLLNNNILQTHSYDNALLISWNFPYYVDQKEFDDLNIGHKHPINNAQMGQINHALYKYAKPLFKWMISCDLDEYMYIENNKLIDFLKSCNYECVKFRNFWAKTILDKKNLSSLYSTEILKNTESDGGDTSKTKVIVKSDKVDAIGVHHTQKLFESNKAIYEYVPQNSYMLHMCNFRNGRDNRINNDQSHIIQIQ